MKLGWHCSLSLFLALSALSTPLPAHASDPPRNLVEFPEGTYLSHPFFSTRVHTHALLPEVHAVAERASQMTAWHAFDPSNVRDPIPELKLSRETTLIARLKGDLKWRGCAPTSPVNFLFDLRYSLDDGQHWIQALARTVTLHLHSSAYEVSDTFVAPAGSHVHFAPRVQWLQAPSLPKDCIVSYDAEGLLEIRAKERPDL